MNNDKYKNYIYDLGMLFAEKALDAKHNKDISSKSDNYDYNIGYLMAFHEIIDIMKQQAKVFNINEKDIGLSGIDAESDLL